MARPVTNTAFEGLLLAAGYGNAHAAFARQLNHAGRDQGTWRYDAASVYWWLRGRRPAEHVQAAMAETLARKLGRPVESRSWASCGTDLAERASTPRPPAAPSIPPSRSGRCSPSTSTHRSAGHSTAERRYRRHSVGGTTCPTHRSAGGADSVTAHRRSVAVRARRPLHRPRPTPRRRLSAHPRAHGRLPRTPGRSHAARHLHRGRRARSHARSRDTLRTTRFHVVRRGRPRHRPTSRDRRLATRQGRR